MEKRNINLIIMLVVIVGLSINVHAAECNSNLIKILHDDVFKPLQIVAPILLLALTTLDFVKAVFTGDDKNGLDKAKSNFIKRAVAVLVIFFAPSIVYLILSIAGEEINAGACISQYWI